MAPTNFSQGIATFPGICKHPQANHQELQLSGLPYYLTFTGKTKKAQKRRFRKLTPAEAKYNVGNRELLSMKEALAECQHWLEGQDSSILCLTLTKNSKADSHTAMIRYTKLHALSPSYFHPYYLPWFFGTLWRNYDSPNLHPQNAPPPDNMFPPPCTLECPSSCHPGILQNHIQKKNTSLISYLHLVFKKHRFTAE